MHVREGGKETVSAVLAHGMAAALTELYKSKSEQWAGMAPQQAAHTHKGENTNMKWVGGEAGVQMVRA